MRILLVEDNDAVANSIYDELNRAGFKEITRVKSLQGAKNKLVSFSPDVVILDINIYEKETDTAGMEDPRYSQELHQYIITENNRRPENQYKIVYLSGSAEALKYKGTYDNAHGVQAVVEKDSDYCNSLLGVLNGIQKNPRQEVISINFSGISEDLRNDIKRFSFVLSEKIENILEKYSNKQYREVIIDCGGLLEELIDEFYKQEKLRFLSKKISDIPDLDSQFNTLRDALNLLIGRRWNKDLKVYDYEQAPRWLISEQSFEYSMFAWKVRGYAAHTKATFAQSQNNIFYYRNQSGEFSMHNAAISIQLIVPILHDYVIYRKKK